MMNYTSVFKRQSFIILSSIVVIAVIIIGTSMAIFADRKEGNTQTLTAGKLSAEISTQTAISAKNPVPMDDEDAKTDSTNVYTFNLTNNGTLPVSYTLTIFNSNSNGNNILEHKYIKVQYDSENAQYLSKLSKVDTNAPETTAKYILKTGTIGADTNGQNKSEQHTIKVWISDVDDTGQETPTSIIGKTISLSIGLTGVVDETEAAKAANNG